MNFSLNLIKVLIKYFFNYQKLNFTDVCISKFRVSPFDLDINMHMNNGRYFTIMDLGRLDLLLQMGYLKRLIKLGYYPVILSESMVFQRSLQCFAAYEIHSQIVGWDKKFFYLCQKFVQNNEVVASAHVRACFKQKKQRGIIDTPTVFSVFNLNMPSTQLNELSEHNIELDHLLLPRD